MSRIIDEHGGSIPSSFHAITKPDIENKVYIIIKTTQPFNIIDLITNLLMNKIAHIFIMVSNDMVNNMNIHPLVSFINNSVDIESYIISNILNEKTIHVFYSIISNMSFIHPQFWEILESARPGTNIQYFNELKENYILYSLTKEGNAKNTIQWPSIAAYANCEKDKEQIKRSVHNAICQKTRMRISEITIDTTQSFTPLCYLATKYMTDKSPYNLITYRHPYTAVYDMFLRPLQKYSTLKLGEIGILNGSSIRMWRDYFPTADIHGFDINKESIDKLKFIKNTKAHLVDERNAMGLRDSLMNASMDGKLFDILLDDASHRLNDQLIFIRDAIDFINPGGMLIIEDIFRKIPITRFQEAIDQISDKVQNAIMILPEHKYSFTADWDNDRILIIWRK